MWLAKAASSSVLVDADDREVSRSRPSETDSMTSRLGSNDSGREAEQKCSGHGSLSERAGKEET